MMTQQMTQVSELEQELKETRQALYDAYKMLAISLDTSLMLSEKLTNAQARWLGKQDAGTSMVELTTSGNPAKY